MSTVTLYNVVSADGFIARPDGREDFIPDEVWTDFIELCRLHDRLVVGRATYETILAYPESLKEELRKVPLNKVVVSGTKFEPLEGFSWAGSPAEALGFGQKILLSSGPKLNQSFIDAQLVDKVILVSLEIEIGSGIKPFFTAPQLFLESEVRSPGKITRTYKVLK